MIEHLSDKIDSLLRQNVALNQKIRKDVRSNGSPLKINVNLPHQPNNRGEDEELHRLNGECKRLMQENDDIWNRINLVEMQKK